MRTILFLTFFAILFAALTFASDNICDSEKYNTCIQGCHLNMDAPTYSCDILKCNTYCSSRLGCLVNYKGVCANAAKYLPNCDVNCNPAGTIAPTILPIIVGFYFLYRALFQ